MTEADFIRNTRDSYDTIAEAYTAHSPSGLGGRAVDRGLVGAFVELVKGRGGEPVADVGSGPGDVTAYLASLGVSVFGVDLSPGMVGIARRRHPELRFHVGSMTGLGLPDRTLGGVFSLFTIMHVPDEQLPVVFGEFERVLAPGGYLLLGFLLDHTTPRLRLTERFGQPITLDYHWRTPGSVSGLLTRAGLNIQAHAVLAPPEGSNRECAYLLARKPEEGAGTAG